MKVRTLLLGTAAAFAVVSGAQAADLAVAEPVSYVKVCDAFGTGYWYIPGTDACLHIGGYVLFDTTGLSSSRAGEATQPAFTALSNPQSYSASWKFYTEEEVDVVAKWMTDFGMATAFIAVRGSHDPGTWYKTNAYDGGLAYIDTVYLKIGGFEAGWDTSLYDYGFLGLIDTPSSFDHDIHQNQLSYTASLGGLSAGVSLEDPRDGVGAAPATGVSPYTGNFPDVIGAVWGKMGSFDWKWSAGVTDTIYGTGYGSQLAGTFTWGGSFLRGQAAVSNGYGAEFGGGLSPIAGNGTVWHVAAQGGIAWTSAFQTLLEGGYLSIPGAHAWEAAAEADWTLAKNLATGVEFAYWNQTAGGPYCSGTSCWQVDWRVKASFGG